jgi:hypothetical protein
VAVTAPDEASNAGPVRRVSPYLPVARTVGRLVAPITLLTALLLFHGLNYSTWYWSHFGLDPSVLELTTQDHLLRTVDALFVPLLGLSVLLLVLLAGHALFGRLRTRWGPTRATRAALLVLVPLGVELVVLGIVGAVQSLRDVLHFLVPPTALGLGVVLLAYAGHLVAASSSHVGPDPEVTHVLQAAAVSGLVVLALFWATADYAAEAGLQRARDDAARLAGGVVVHSERRLILDGPGVEEIRCVGAEAAYPFRYHGLRLLVRSGGRYVLLPAAWSPRQGVALVVPVTDVQRLDLVPATTSLATAVRSC